jgi:hypothetical protein
MCGELSCLCVSSVCLLIDDSHACYTHGVCFVRTGRYLAGSFLSEENKMMIELKAAAERRSVEAAPESKESSHGHAPFGWLLTHFGREW